MHIRLRNIRFRSLEMDAYVFIRFEILFQGICAANTVCALAWHLTNLNICFSSPPILASVLNYRYF